MDIQPAANLNLAAQRPVSGPAEGTSPAKVAGTLATATDASQAAPAASLGQISDAVKSINEAMQSLSPDLQFSVDTDSNRTVVKVVDQQTNEVIRQMPSAEALEIAKALDKVQGLLIRQKA